MPNVIGLKLADGLAEMSNAGVTVGTVDVNTQFSSLDNGIIRSARAAVINCDAADCSDAIINSQDQDGGVVWDFVDVNLTAVQVVAIPEPATLKLFAVGLILLVLIVWWRHRVH